MTRSLAPSSERAEYLNGFSDNNSIDSLVGGASLVVAWQLKDKNVLIVGGGEVASGRVESVLVADAVITIVCPQPGLHSKTKRLIDQYPNRITYHDRCFSGPDDLHNMDMVLTAIDDPEISREIVEHCRIARVPVNAADIPDLCDFFFGAQIRDGPLQILISTNGNGPRLSSLIKQRIQNSLSGLEGQAIRRIGKLRAQLKVRAPGVGGQVGRQRMRWMTQISNQWSMEELTQLDDTMIERLLDEGWEKDCIPTFESLGGKHSKKDASSKNAPSLDACWLGSNPLLPSLTFVAGGLLVAAFFLVRQRAK